MIIGATRVRSASGHEDLANHIWRGDETEVVITLQGAEADLQDMVEVARNGGHPNAIRHFHLSPGEPMTDAEAFDLVGRIGAEFGFAAEGAVVVRHVKPRRTAHDPMFGTQGNEWHWHMLVPEVDPVTLRVLDSRQMFARHERLARDTELRLLHRVIKGRHNFAVIAAFEVRGDHQAVRRLRAAGIDEGPPAFAAYTSRQRRLLERRHSDHTGEPLDLPKMVRQLQTSWAAHAPNLDALAAALRRQGLRLRHPADPVQEGSGRVIAPAPITRGTGWVVDAWDSGRQEAFVLGAAHRLLREPRARVDETLRPRRPRASLAPELPVVTPAADPVARADEPARAEKPGLGSR